MHKPMSTTSSSSSTTTSLLRAPAADDPVNNSSRRRSSAPPRRRMGQDEDIANEGPQDDVSSSRIPRRSPRSYSYTTSVLLLCLSSLIVSVESQAPTFNPTRGPTLQPTSVPTRAPTAVPTRIPTSFPTSEPTRAPTQPPTRQPTRLPTSLPTSRPTRMPTSLPTRAPTSVPTRVPTAVPTRGPTNVPTRGPTSFPTQLPTLGPTQAPSTQGPTQAPSKLPTQVPSFSPSGGPTPLPSASPSALPTTFTPVPTITFRPTDQPSAVPTGIPSAIPSPFPTPLPSIAPSALPSPSPSSSPSLSQQLFEIDSVMRMSNMMKTMDSGARIDWEGSTAAHIRNVMNSLELDDELLQLQVFTDINSQVLLIPEEVPESDGATRRYLQTGVEGATLFPLQVEFLVRVTFRSARTDYDLVDLIGEAFNSAEERQQYRARLKQLNADFDNLERVEILVNGTIPREEGLQAPDDGKGGGSGSVLIIAVAAGGVVMALVALSCLAYRRWGQDSGYDAQQVTYVEGGNGSKATEPSAQQSGITAEILMERQDDVSTLGDPVFGMMTTHDVGADNRDEATASVGNDYDYSKQWLKAQGIASVTGDSSRGRLTSTDSESKRTVSTHTGLVAPPSVFSDDASFEQQFDAAADANLRFEVSVPPGKLGMVIDTPHGGVPLVHAIKPNSVLADKCMVNDRLVAVDGEDVTSMTAVQVSKLISLKADQQRTLVFVRPRADPR